MCLYMNVPLWINVERLTTAVSTTASQFFDVSLVIFLLNCKSSTAVKAAKTAAASTTTQQPSVSTSSSTLKSAARHECKQFKQRLQQTQTNTINTTTISRVATVAAVSSSSTTTTTQIKTTKQSLYFNKADDKIQHSPLPTVDDAGV